MPNPPRILIVDDSRASRRLSGAFVKSICPSCEIIEAGDAAEALAAGPADLSILDMNMPGMSGLDLAEAMLARCPGALLAILTANGQESVRQRAGALRIPMYRKPVTQNVIAEILAALPERD